jgi:probable HAF family extracellular repeat protein
VPVLGRSKLAPASAPFFDKSSSEWHCQVIMRFPRAAALRIRAYITGACFFLALVIHASAAPPRFKVIPLGTLGGLESQANAINSLGHIAGWSRDTNGNQRAYLYTNGVMINLGTLGGDASEALGLNDWDQVVGWSKTTNGVSHAFVFRDNQMVDLGTLGGTDSSAAGINNNGRIVGWAFNCGYSFSPLCESNHPFIQHAFRTELNRLVDLGTLGGPHSAATAVNKFGDIAGWSFQDDNSTLACRWTDAGLASLGTLGPYPQSEALAMNDAGHAVGYSYPPSSSAHAFLVADGVMHDLGTFSPALSSKALWINNYDDVVGSTDIGAFLYTSGQMFRLSQLTVPPSVYEFSEATGINDAGQIVVNWPGPAAFLLTPLPLPRITGMWLDAATRMLRLEWTAPGGVFVEFTPALNPGATDWQTLAGPFTATNCELQLPAGLNTSFFRLRSALN